MKYANFGVIFFNCNDGDKVVKAIENLKEVSFDDGDEIYYQIFPCYDVIFSVDMVFNALNTAICKDNYCYTFYNFDSYTFVSNNKDTILILIGNTGSLDTIKFSLIDEAKEYVSNEYEVESAEHEGLKVPKDFVYFLT